MAQPFDPKTAWNGMGTGWAITSTMIAGLLTFGMLGFLVDLLAGTDPVFVSIGIIVGAAASIYLVYLRYGRSDDGKT